MSPDHTTFLTTLAKQDPTLHTDLARLARKHPLLTDRSIRGAQLYLDNAIEQTPAGDYYVRSQTGPLIYYVSRDDIRCTCPDAQNGAPSGPADRKWCKHMIACVLHFRYQETQREF